MSEQQSMPCSRLPARLWWAMSNYYYGASEENSADCSEDDIGRLLDGPTVEVPDVRRLQMEAAFFGGGPRYNDDGPNTPSDVGIEVEEQGDVIRIGAGPGRDYMPMGFADREQQKEVSEDGGESQTETTE